MLDLVVSNLVSPAVLCFALGALAQAFRSDLRMPDSVFAGLSMYLMLAIGLKGGAELSGQSLSSIAAPVAAALVLGCAIPLWCYGLLRTFFRLEVADAAALAAHYGSVSAVTFAAVTAMLDRQGLGYEGFMAAILAVMEVPAIIVALALAGAAQTVQSTVTLRGTMALGGTTSPGTGLSQVLSDALSSKSIWLLGGGLVIGALVGPQGLTKVKPLFVDLFQGLLCLFLLELGRLAASRIVDFAKVGIKLAAFAVIMPVIHGLIGIIVSRAAGLSEGGAIVLATLAASASYIAAPAAVRTALPEANPAYYLTCSLAITFPFNIALGIPLYSIAAKLIYG